MTPGIHLFVAMTLVIYAPSAYALPATPAIVSWVTYLGGPDGDQATSVAADASGNTYVAGYTQTNGVLQAWVAKVDTAGTTVLFKKDIAGHGSTISGIALDPAGNIYVIGGSGLDFQCTPNAYQISGAGYVIKLSNQGDRVIYSTRIGALPFAIAVDSSGAAYLTGTAGSDLPTTPGALQPRQALGGSCGGRYSSGGPCLDAFVLKLNPAGTAAEYATFLGGAQEEQGNTIAVDGTGAAYVGGATASADFPVTGNAFQRKFRGRILFGPLWYGDGFAAKIDPSGHMLEWSTYLGGSGPDSVGTIAVDHKGYAYAAGGTSSDDFPTILGALVRTAPAGGFVTKIGPDGSAAYSTYTGGGAMTLDADGQAYLDTDNPQPTDICPTRESSLQVLSSDGTHLIVPANFSGPGYTGSSTLALDGAGNAYTAGISRSIIFFATPGSAQPNYGGGDSDAFVAKVSFTAPKPRFIACILNAASLLAGNKYYPQDGAVSPGEIVSLYGNDIGPPNPLPGQGSPGGKLGTMLGNTQVLFDGVPAPLLYAGPTQINAVVPFAVRKTTNVVLRRGSTDTGPILLPVTDAVLGLFTIDGSGSGEVAAFNQNGTINSVTNPAPRGSAIAIYATGFGLINPGVADGSIMPLTLPLPKPQLGLSATLGLKPATIEYAGAAPGFVAGAFQVNVRIPPDSDTGPAVPLSLFGGGFITQQPALLNQLPVSVAIAP